MSQEVTIDMLIQAGKELGLELAKEKAENVRLRAELHRQHMEVRKAHIENYPVAKAGLDAGDFTIEELPETFDEDLKDLVALIGLEKFNAGTKIADLEQRLERNRGFVIDQSAEITRLRSELDFCQAELEERIQIMHKPKETENERPAAGQ